MDNFKNSSLIGRLVILKMIRYLLRQRSPSGVTKHKLAFKGAKKTLFFNIMNNLARFNAADLPALFERINKNSIGMDEYFDRLFNLHETTKNYPPFNLVQVSNVESRLEIALAGFKKKEVNVYTQDGKLFVEGQKEDKETETNYLHKGLGPTVVYTSVDSR